MLIFTLTPSLAWLVWMCWILPRQFQPVEACNVTLTIAGIGNSPQPITIVVLPQRQYVVGYAAPTWASSISGTFKDGDPVDVFVGDPYFLTVVCVWLLLFVHAIDINVSLRP
jgi:hypothetical protein